MFVTLLLIAQAVLTGVTALVLLIAPDAIPASFGLTLTRDAHLLCYFYGATELGLSFASVAALRLGERSTLRLACIYFMVVHAAEGFAGAYAVVEGFPTKVMANSAAHALIAVLFAVAAFRRPASRPVRA